MFKQKNEEKNKNEGFVGANGEELAPQPQKETKEENPNDVKLDVPFEYSDDHLKHVEEQRLKFFATVRKQNIVKWIVAVFAIGLLVFAWIFVMNQLKIVWLGVLLVVLSIGIIIAYYFITKQYNNKKMEAYLKDFYGDVNAYVFNQDGFSDVNGDIAGKIDNAEFNASNLYKDVSTVGSRNVINFKVNHQLDVKMCDCAAQKTTMRKLEPLFIGKYLIAKNNYNNDDPIYVYLTGNSRALPPNNLDNIPKVINTKKMIVYSNNKNYESTINSRVREGLANIITNNILVDVSISIQKGMTYIGLGYDDCLMVLPLQERFNPIPVERFKSDIKIVADVLTNLN